MTIRFKCQNTKCQKVLVVKDELAGKKARCPACKTSVSIPAPRSEPTDLEDFAAAAFADDPAEKKPAAEAPKEKGTIDFTCDYCEAELHLPAAEAGKQVPCPECRKIIKVPKLKEDKPKDWRRAAEKIGPSFAKHDAPEKPPGAWETGKSKVSQEALEEAGVITEPEEPRTLKEKLRLPLYLAGGAALIVGLWLISSKLLSKSAQKRALDAALAYVEPKPKLSPLHSAEIYRAAGEFHLQNGKAQLARGAFAKARKSLTGNLDKDKAAALDRELLLTAIALNQVDLGGGEQQVLGGKDQERLEWNDVDREIRGTLNAIQSPEAQAAAVAAVSRRLSQRGQKDNAISLAINFKGGPANAGTKGDEAHAFGEAQLLALLLGNDKDTKLPPLPKDKKKPLDLKTRLAYAQGKALKGDFEGAHDVAVNYKSLNQDKLHALLAVATIAQAQGNTTVAETCINAAKKMENSLDTFQAVQLGRLAVRAGLADITKRLEEVLKDKKAARSRIELELVLIELENLAKNRTPAPKDLIDSRIKDKDTLAYAQAQEAVARHNTRLGQRAEVLESVESLDEKLRPFVQIGVALGIQDTEKP